MSYLINLTDVYVKHVLITDESLSAFPFLSYQLVLKWLAFWRCESKKQRLKDTSEWSLFLFIWSQSCPKVLQKLFLSCLKVLPKLCQTGLKTSKKLCQRRVKVAIKVSQSCFKFVSKFCEIRVKVVSNLTQRCLKVFLSSNLCQNHVQVCVKVASLPSSCSSGAKVLSMQFLNGARNKHS